MKSAKSVKTKYRIILTHEGKLELSKDPVMGAVITGIGIIGCTEVSPDGHYLHATALLDNAKIEVYIPNHYVSHVASYTNVKEPKVGFVDSKHN